MKKLSILLIITLMLGVTACGKSDKKEEVPAESTEVLEEEVLEEAEESEETEVVKIHLSNGDILVNEEKITEAPEELGIYQAHDIVFYLEDQGIEYGEGIKADEHSQIEGDAHTVLHITKPGTYEVSGSMDAGQILVDLGKDAKDDPEAVVTLILNNANITCTVAPAILFENVYECAQKSEEEEEIVSVDTSKAGANIFLMDKTSNEIYGSYVAKIYESCELNEEGTEVVDSKKLYKYDGAVYSKMSMNIFGGETGSMTVNAEKEGISAEMHLTVNGGNIEIISGNDGINVNENKESVFTMNGGNLKVTATGKSGEGDGIDSNGALVVNGGTIETYACGISTDSGLDSEFGVSINGGTVVSTGDVFDSIGDGKQKSAVFILPEKQIGGETYEVRDGEENVILEVTPANDFKVLVISSEEMQKDAAYTLWFGRDQIAEEAQKELIPESARPQSAEEVEKTEE